MKRIIKSSAMFFFLSAPFFGHSIRHDANAPIKTMDALSKKIRLRKEVNNNTLIKTMSAIHQTTDLGTMKLSFSRAISPSEKVNKVRWDEHLYLHLILEDKISSLLSLKDLEAGQMSIGITIGDQIHYIIHPLSMSELESTSLVLDLLPQADSAQTDYIGTTFISVIEMMHRFLVVEKRESNYVEGKGFVDTVIPAKYEHEVSVWYAKEEGWPPSPILSQTCILDYTNFSNDQLLQKGVQAKQNVEEFKIKNVFLPRSFDDDGSFADLELSKERIIKVFEFQVSGSKVKDIAIEDGSDEWIIETDFRGNPFRKYTAKAIRIAFTLDGKCYYNERMYLERMYLGDGKYGDIKVPGSAVSSNYLVRMSCENL